LNNKRLLCVLFIVLYTIFLFTLSLTASAQAVPSVILKSNKTVLAPGYEADITVSLSDYQSFGKEINGFQFEVSYNPEQLEPVLENGKPLITLVFGFPGSVSVDADIISDGRLCFVWYEYNTSHIEAGLPSSATDLFKFKLKSKNSQSNAASAISLTSVKASYADNSTDGFSVFEPGKSADLLIQTGPLDFLPGDINQNGALEVVDLTMLKLHLVQRSPLTDKQLLIADITLNGIIDSHDLVHMKKCILGLEVS